MSDDDMEHERRRRGLWVHWVGDAITGISLLVAVLVGYGKLDQRVANIEEAQKQNASERVELKRDIQIQMQNILSSISQLDGKITAVLINGQQGKR